MTRPVESRATEAQPPQLWLYVCADTQARADEIVAMGIREPDGLLRRLEATVTA
jgi:hypothetical protein